MIQNTELNKKTGEMSILKRILLIFAIFLGVIVAATAALYIYSKTAKTTQDDVAAIVSAKAMPAAERYSFDAASSKMEISMDKSDLWWLLEEMDKGNLVEEIADDMKSYGVTLESYGLDITDKGILISAELTYGNFLRLPLKLLADASVTDGTLTILPAKVYLGKIRLPVEKLLLTQLSSQPGMDSDFSINGYKYDVASSDLDLLPMLTDIYFKDNRMVMVYTLNESLFAQSVNAFGDNLDWYAEECTDCIEVLREYSEEGALGKRFTKLVENFSSNPENFSAFIAETLAVAPESEAKRYMDKNEPWLLRLMPEITAKSVSDLHTALYNHCAERAVLVTNLMDTLLSSYNSGKLKIDKGGFIYNNKPFDLESYLGGDWDKYSGWLDASTFRPVLVKTSDVYDAKTPLLRKITSSKDYIDTAGTLNEKFPIGFIVKMKDGSPVLQYRHSFIGNNEKVQIENTKVSLDSAAYESLKNNPLVPVWRD